MKKMKKYNSGGPTSKIGSATDTTTKSSQQVNVDAVNKAALEKAKKQNESKKEVTPPSNSMMMVKKGGSITALNKVQEMYSKKKK
jgi:hypothetical protein